MEPCYKCKRCNVIGKPTAMRGSAYCDSHKKFGVKTKRVGIFQKAKDYIFQKRWDEEKQTMKTTRGFRKSWFWR